MNIRDLHEEDWERLETMWQGLLRRNAVRHLPVDSRILVRWWLLSEKIGGRWFHVLMDRENASDQEYVRFMEELSGKCWKKEALT